MAQASEIAGGQVATPPASSATAQTRLGLAQETVDRRGRGVEGEDFEILARVRNAAEAAAYERKSGDPIYRPLRIFALDPSASKRDGAVSVVNVPYEPLEPGPHSPIFKVVDYGTGELPVSEPLDLERPDMLIQQGCAPSENNPQFRAQMAYAVCATTYAAFRLALGRTPAWQFQRASEVGTAKPLVIHACCDGMQNAYYDPERGELRFGAYRATAVAGRNVPGQMVYTVLLHDVVVHETTHALLDGLRSRFMEPSNPDVLAFHEAFADLVAIFQRFTYRDVVRAALRRARGELRAATILTQIGLQFGQTIGRAGALRSAVSGTAQKYGDETEPHARGEVLLAAVFEAFRRVYEDKAARYVRLASGGTGVLPAGEIPETLLELMTELACKLASEFLSICIRAIDYCPPVDITFGEYLRAVITADTELVPDDRWGYRESWIDAFRAYGIYPSDVATLSEDSLVWRGPDRMVPAVPELGFAHLQFAGDPARPASSTELMRQARELGALITDPEYLEVFGLAQSGDPRLNGDAIELPKVESIRSARRVGPSGQIVFDLVAEVTQRRLVSLGEGDPSFAFYGGSTIILDPVGSIRYVVRKSVLQAARIDRTREFTRDNPQLWQLGPGAVLFPEAQPFKLLHESNAGRGEVDAG